MTLPGWTNFPVLSLLLEVEMLDSYRLPPFAGSLFRGCLGWALQDVCSSTDYRFLFETREGESEVPRPFVLLPPLNARDLRPGDRLRLALRLFGQGCQFADSFLQAIARIGDVGLGQSRARFHISRVVADEGRRHWVCYDKGLKDGNYIPLPCGLGNFAWSNWDECQALEVDFVTPTRIVHKGNPARQPDFHVIVRALLRRIETLLQQHGGQGTGLDYRAEVVRSEGIQMTPLGLRWEDWERKSNRQGRNITMGGLVGKARYEGDFNPEVLRLLQAGEVLHLGKSTTFGMGAVAISVPDLKHRMPDVLETPLMNSI